MNVVWFYGWGVVKRRRDLARKELNGRRVSGWRALERQSDDQRTEPQP